MAVEHKTLETRHTDGITLAEPVSVLQNMEIWSCREQQRSSTDSFSVAAPVIWNSLSEHLRSSCISKGQFRHGSKTHLFQRAYNI